MGEVKIMFSMGNQHQSPWYEPWDPQKEQRDAPVSGLWLIMVSHGTQTLVFCVEVLVLASYSTLLL